MEVRGREIKFLRTVKTTADLANLCPEKDINRLSEIFTYNTADTILNCAKFIQILNEGYEMAKSFTEEGYKPNVISLEELLYLDEDTFTNLQEEALNAYNYVETTVEVETSKKKVKTQEEE